MYKRFIAIILSLSFILLFAAGCANKEEEVKTLESKQTIDTILCDNTWNANVLGFNVSISFQPDGKGHVDAAGISKDFDYTLSNTTTDPLAGDITITGTGVSEIDGETAHCEYKNNNITVSYDDMSYTFTPESDNA